MVPFNTLLNLQPSRFALWIKFYFCSGVNLWSRLGFHPHPQLYEFPQPGPSLFLGCPLSGAGAGRSWFETAPGNVILAQPGEGVTLRRGKGDSFRLFRAT